MWDWIKRRRERRRLAAKRAVWSTELDRLGVWAVRKKLDQDAAGHNASVYGFSVGPIEREFVERWLRKKEEAAAPQVGAHRRICGNARRDLGYIAHT